MARGVGGEGDEGDGGHIVGHEGGEGGEEGGEAGDLRRAAHAHRQAYADLLQRPGWAMTGYTYYKTVPF